MSKPIDKIVLASTSPYRKQLLESLLGPGFKTQKPDLDEEQAKIETLKHNSDPLFLAETLSYLKGQSVATEGQITISGDQLLSLDNQIFGKPGNFQAACQQLNLLKGKTHSLITAVTVFDGKTAHKILNISKITLKDLTPGQIENYVSIDTPYDCAGSYKIEKNGLQLMKSIQTDDHTAIQGIPLLAVSMTLGRLGLAIPSEIK